MCRDVYTYKASGGSSWPLTGLRKECFSSKELHGWCQKRNRSLWLNWPFCRLGGLVNIWTSFTVHTRGEGGGPNRQRETKNLCLNFFSFCLQLWIVIWSCVLGWPKSSFEFSHKMLWKSPTNIVFGQPSISNHHVYTNVIQIYLSVILWSAWGWGDLFVMTAKGNLGCG